VQQGIEIRSAGREDVPTIFRLIRELADFEMLGHAVRGDERLLEESLFERRAAEALLIEEGGEAVGYAIFFTTFSTFECRPGLWLEDVYVRPDWRRRGIGREVLTHIARLAVERDCARIEWLALNWNEPALRFYEALGAIGIDDWRALRLEGETLRRLGSFPG
jgi:GNAT superfamily N-acetyltransferase